MLTRLAHNDIFDIDRFARLHARYSWLQPGLLLPAYFFLISFVDLSRHYPQDLGIDARIYYRAAVAFTEGISPWSAFVTNTRGNDLHFASLPPTVLIFQPFAAFPEKLVVWMWILLSVGAAFTIVRRLRLPIWWLAFPPIAEGIFSANPQIVLLALILSGSSALAAIAPLLKIYALAPLVGERRVRALVITLAALIGSVAIAPGLWFDYLAHGEQIAERVLAESHGGYSALGQSVALTAATVLGLGLLAVVDFRAAGWLAAPALVPASQFHLSTMALPVLAQTRNLFLILMLATPIRGYPSAAIAIYGVWRCYRFVRARREGSGAPQSTGPEDAAGSH